VVQRSIRPYSPADLDALYDICLRTGAAGRDGSGLVEDPLLFGQLFAAPYAILEPEHAFVLDDGRGRAVGYVLGALDTRSFEARCEADWWPLLRTRYPRRPDGRRVDDLLISLIHRPIRAADEVVARYPSHLHIDLLAEAQGAGWGRQMMDAVLQALRTQGSRGVHLGVSTRNTAALGFYDHLNFTELTRDATTVVMGQDLVGPGL